jgi:hypothetical protein
MYPHRHRSGYTPAMSIDLTITARQDGTGPDDGMALGELEDTLATLRSLGATARTHLVVVPNRAHRVDAIAAEHDWSRADTLRTLLTLGLRAWARGERP